VDGSGNLLANGVTDPNYFLTATSPQDPSGTVPLTAVASGFPFPYWAANTATSEWIGANTPGGDGNLTAPVGEYDVATTFNLTNFDPTSFALTGQFLSDNEILGVLINGYNLGSFGQDANTFTDWTSFNIDQTNAATDLNAGLNTITFEVMNDSYAEGPNDNPMGLQVTIESATANATPEPGTLGLLGTALIGLGLMARRRRSTNRVLPTAVK
jgi:hypothetical protein